MESNALDLPGSQLCYPPLTPVNKVVSTKHKSCNNCAQQKLIKRKKQNRRNRRMVWSQVNDQHYRLERLSQVFDDVDGKLQKNWKTNLLELFSIAAEFKQDRIDEFIKQIKNGKY